MQLNSSEEINGFLNKCNKNEWDQFVNDNAEKNPLLLLSVMSKLAKNENRLGAQIIWDTLEMKGSYFEEILAEQKENIEICAWILICYVQSCNYRFQAKELMELMPNRNTGQLLDFLRRSIQWCKSDDRMLLSVFKMMYEFSLPGTYFSNQEIKDMQNHSTPVTHFYAIEEYDTKMSELMRFVMDDNFLEQLLKAEDMESYVKMISSKKIPDDLNKTECFEWTMQLWQNVLQLLDQMISFALLHPKLNDSFISAVLAKDTVLMKFLIQYLEWLCSDAFIWEGNFDKIKQDEDIWYELQDEYGQNYYYNPDTQQSVWHIPVASQSNVERIRCQEIVQVFQILIKCAYYSEGVILNPTIQLLNAQYQWIFQNSAPCLAHLLMLNVNLDSFQVSKDKSCQQDAMADKVCELLAILAKDIRETTMIEFSTNSNIPIHRNNGTYQLTVGALSAQEVLDGLYGEGATEDDWEELFDEEQQLPYFYNHKTAQCVWEKPKKLAPEWSELYSEEHDCYYYYNSNTQESSWDRNEAECSGVIEEGLENKDCTEAPQSLMRQWLLNARSNMGNMDSDSKQVDLENKTLSAKPSQYRLLGDLPQLAPPKVAPPSTKGPKPPKNKRRPAHKSKNVRSGSKFKDIAAPPKVPTDVPARFLCEISHVMMQQPVSSVHGNSFDRTSIQKWLAHAGQICPITQKSLCLDQLTDNEALLNEIKLWKIQQSLQSKPASFAQVNADTDSKDIYEF